MNITSGLAYCCFFLLALLPIALSNGPAGASLGIVLLAIIFFFPGYLLSKLSVKVGGDLRILLSPIFGIVSVTTLYDMFVRSSVSRYFPYLVVVLSAAGLVFFCLNVSKAVAPRWETSAGYEVVFAGSVAALCIAPLDWRSGRFSASEFVFYGPAGQDPLFHVTLMQRLLHHVPPDNFIVSGLRAPVYHYFDDLMLALVLRLQSALHLGATDLFDLYYRCYPTLLYFLLGALAYRTGKQLLGTRRSGVLSLLLLLGAGGLGWFFGVLQTAAHAPHLVMMRELLFSSWTSWEGVDSILPLVHRPAHYQGLLICLAAINVLLRIDRSRRDWIVAGLLLGMMAGFNFTLAATFGIAAVLACFLWFLWGSQDEAHDLLWLAASVFVGSLPITVPMLLSGFHNPAAGFPFRGPNLQFPTAMWGGPLSRIMPSALVPWAALLLFPVVAYGVKLFGVGAMMRFDLGAGRNRGIATVLAIACALSFVIGMFFPYAALGGQGIIFIQPTLWILGLFSLGPIYRWLQQNKGNWRAVAIWGMLGLTWVQALGAFNFSHKVAFSQDAVHVLQDIRSAAAPTDVLAYLPSNLIAKAILGRTGESTNFAIMALTGLDGYFSSQTYCEFFAVPGLGGGNPAEVLASANRLCEQRRGDIESFIKGDISNTASARLAADRVRWIVISGAAMQGISPSATPWREARDIVVYRMDPRPVEH